jgi:O-antigen ligase
MDLETQLEERAIRREKLADRLETIARRVTMSLAIVVCIISPWFFGGMGPDGRMLLLGSGALLTIPLGLWVVTRVLRRRGPRAAFWLPVLFWGMLAVQVVASTFNSSHAPQAPWEGSGFNRIAHNEWWPSTAFKGATIESGWMWGTVLFLALMIRTLNPNSRQIRLFLWLLVGNATLLALVGIPFKFSGSMKILGLWPAPEWYFYSTFLYHNHWCAYALLACAAAAALFLTHESTAVRAGLVCAACILAGSAPLSVSRLGTLAMLGFSVFAVVILKQQLASARRAKAKARAGTRPPMAAVPAADAPKPKSAKGALIGAAVLGVLIFGGSVLYFRNELGKAGGHRDWNTLLHTSPFYVRRTLFEDTLPMIGEKPMFGWGLGAYGAAFRGFQRADTRIVHNNGRVTLYEHPHDDWLELLAELGFVGMILLLTPWLYWLKRAKHSKRLNGSRFWMMMGCAAIAVFAIGEIIFFNRAVAATFAVMFAMAVSPGLAQLKTRENPT